MVVVLANVGFCVNPNMLLVVVHETCVMMCSEATFPFCTVRKRKRAVGRADDDSLNEEIHHHHRRDGELPALPISKSYTVQHTRISISSSSNQTRPGFTRGTINTDYNQANPGFTRQAITKDYNQTTAGFTTASNQTKPDFIRHVSNSGSDRVPPSNKPCLVRSSAAPPISRWTQFLSVPHPQGEEEEDDEEEEEERRLVNNIESKPLDRLGSSATPCSLSNIRELGHQSEVPKAVWPQTPPPINQPCPSLPVNSLFNTGDDFDAFNFDDMF